MLAGANPRRLNATTKLYYTVPVYTASLTSTAQTARPTTTTATETAVGRTAARGVTTEKMRATAKMMTTATATERRTIATPEFTTRQNCTCRLASVDARVPSLCVARSQHACALSFQSSFLARSCVRLFLLSFVYLLFQPRPVQTTTTTSSWRSVLDDNSFCRLWFVVVSLVVRVPQSLSYG